MEKRRVQYKDEDGQSQEAMLYDNEPHDGVESPENHHHIEIIPKKDYVCEFIPESYYVCILNKEYKSEDLSVLENLLKDFMESEGAEIPTDMAI